MVIYAFCLSSQILSGPSWPTTTKGGGGWFPKHLEASNFGNKPVAKFKSRQIWQQRLKAYDGHLAARVRKKWSKVFNYFPKSVLSIVTSKKKKIKNKQTNQPFNLLWKTCVTLYGFPFLKLWPGAFHSVIFLKH